MERAEPGTRGSTASVDGRVLHQPSAPPMAANLALRDSARPLLPRLEGPPKRSWRSRRRLVSTPVHRGIVAVDIEDSTSRTNPIKEELRGTVYRVLVRALRAVGIGDHHLDRLARSRGWRARIGQAC